MKKVIGVLGVAVCAMAMFFSANVSSSTYHFRYNLTNLLTMNEADAECSIAGSGNGICVYVTSGSMACIAYPNGNCS